MVVLDLGKFNSVVGIRDFMTRRKQFVTFSVTLQTHDFLIQHSNNAPRSVVFFETRDAAKKDHTNDRQG